ncbi:MAG: chromosomal replication initiator protein DnaA, partial [Methylococcales bacterium]|nr:chromosomal replication initiator protein DnaA [Methylococcales bacterium]
MSLIWPQITSKLEIELPSKEFNTWIRPLQTIEQNKTLTLLAPNHFVLEWVHEHYLPRIQEIVVELKTELTKVQIEIGSKQHQIKRKSGLNRPVAKKNPLKHSVPSNLNKQFNFQNFIVGKSNQLAKAAATQVTENIGGAYNPLLIYGSSGLGKTHLMHAIGNNVLVNNPNAKIIYLHSERFVQDMVKALQHNTMSAFKNFYRNIDVLLIDDIQFFAGKERSQEEFFHTFNTLLENKHQIVLTSDKFPKEINGLEDRLKSRFGWG